MEPVGMRKASMTNARKTNSLDGLPVRVVHHTRIMGAYDNLIARFGPLGKALRSLLQAAEKTPLRLFGLSHLLVIEKMVKCPGSIATSSHTSYYNVWRFVLQFFHL